MAQQKVSVKPHLVDWQNADVVSKFKIDLTKLLFAKYLFEPQLEIAQTQKKLSNCDDKSLFKLENELIFDADMILLFFYLRENSESNLTNSDKLLLAHELTNSIRSFEEIESIMTELPSLKDPYSFSSLLLFARLCHDPNIKNVDELKFKNLSLWLKNVSKVKELQDCLPEIEELLKTWHQIDSKKTNLQRQVTLSKELEFVQFSPTFKSENMPDRVPIPIEGKRNILITSALPYVNNVPHLGNVIGSTLSADVYSRYCKAKNYNTLYICGTDEYGTATETKAIEEKCTPQQLCDKYHKLHKEVYDWFDINFDIFGRTSTEKQTKIASEIFLDLYKNEYLDERVMTQLYCNEHKAFLADRFVEGICPKCKFVDARGDQCDGCGNLLDPLDLIEPHCKLDGSVPVVKDTRHIFLLLDKLQPDIEKWAKVSSEVGQWSANGKNITKKWFKDGLHPRCITRDLKWGTPVPLEGWESKVLYVWFDAPIGYCSITANLTDDWEKWWKNPQNVELCQFMGKDNVPFHSVIFPGCLLGTNNEWTKLHHLNVTEYLNYEGGKFSKSRNRGVFGTSAERTGISSDIWRYYLLSSRPETSDSMFTWKEFALKNNTDLLNTIGNFVNRVLKFLNAKFDGRIPEYDQSPNEYTSPLIEKVNEYLSSYKSLMEIARLRDGLRIVTSLASYGNLFLQDNKFDNKLLVEDPLKCSTILAYSVNMIYVISSLIYPFMPKTSKSILDQINCPPMFIPDEFICHIQAGHEIQKAQHLFSRITDDQVESWKSQFGA